MMSSLRNGILCLETIWFDEVENPSTRHLLELLKRLSGIPFVYRDVSTFEEFDFHLGRWVGRKTSKKDYVLGDYGILYLGFHGSPGEISLREDLTHKGDDDEIDLDGIAEMDLVSTKNMDNPDTLRTLSRRLHHKPEYAGLAEHLGFKMIV